MIYNFIKENNQWFVDLPEYIKQGGKKADLEMVLGADKLCDFLANGKNHINVILSEEPIIPKSEGYLDFKEFAPNEGADYICWLDGKKAFDVWLCPVTKFVFGKYPKIIYIKNITK